MANVHDTEERLRELVREANAATKDLRAAIKDAQHALTERVDTAVTDRLDKAVEEGIGKLHDVVQRTCDQVEAGLDRRFTKLANLMLTGKPDGVGGDHIVNLGRTRLGQSPVDIEPLLSLADEGGADDATD